MAKGNKTGGREKGTPNKKTCIGEKVEELLEKEFENIEDYLQRLNSKERLEFIVKLLPYATPRKSQSVTEVKADIWEPPLFITE